MSILFNTQRVRALVAATVFALSMASASAADVKVKLTGAEETPPVTTSASATATITIAADKSVSGTIKTVGIDGTVAHFHVGAPSEAGPAIITLNKGADSMWSVRQAQSSRMSSTRASRPAISM